MNDNLAVVIIFGIAAVCSTIVICVNIRSNK
jgi:hypothetical protein